MIRSRSAQVGGDTPNCRSSLPRQASALALKRNSPNGASGLFPGDRTRPPTPSERSCSSKYSSSSRLAGPGRLGQTKLSPRRRMKTPHTLPFNRGYYESRSPSSPNAQCSVSSANRRRLPAELRRSRYWPCGAVKASRPSALAGSIKANGSHSGRPSSGPAQTSWRLSPQVTSL